MSPAPLLALPATLLVAAPLLVPHRATRLAFAQRWLTWSLGWFVVSALVAAWLLVTSEGTPLPEHGSVAWQRIVLLGSVGGLLLANRYARLYLISGARATLSLASAISMVAGGMLLMLLAEPYGLVWWAAHAIDGLAVLAIGVAAMVLAVRGRAVARLLAPAARVDPLVALEIGLTPEVHAFVAALERKDQMTRDHVVRVAELAVRVGERAGLPAAQLRRLGLAGLMHDIGKLVVPTDVLTKPGRLTEHEWAEIRTHSEHGARLIEDSPALAEIADLVRWHHERPDGAGYPDGLHDEEIPHLVALLSVCDAWDAIVHTRHYQKARDSTTASAIMRGGAGTQWSAHAVEVLLDVVEAHPADAPQVLSHIGGETRVDGCEPTPGLATSLTGALAAVQPGAGDTLIQRAE